LSFGSGNKRPQKVSKSNIAEGCGKMRKDINDFRELQLQLQLQQYYYTLYFENQIAYYRAAVILPVQNLEAQTGYEASIDKEQHVVPLVPGVGACV
jgi:hypothetical protein